MPANRLFLLDEINILPYMSVKLDGGDAFKIRTLQLEDQFVSLDRATEWNFDVTALDSGEQHLNLVVGVRLKHSGESDETRFYPLYDRKIDVEVDVGFTVTQFVTNHWEALLTIIVIPLVGLGYREWRNRKKKTSWGFKP